MVLHHKMQPCVHCIVFCCDAIIFERIGLYRIACPLRCVGLLWPLQHHSTHSPTIQANLTQHHAIKAQLGPVLELQPEARPAPVLEVGAELAPAHGPGLDCRPELPPELASRRKLGLHWEPEPEPDLGPTLLNYRHKM